tara:strand:- start:128 stop:361 length:234 start_codon:yes stop_codon:yes gene_type:complete
MSVEVSLHRWEKKDLPTGKAYKYNVYHGDILIHTVITDGDEESVRKMLENNTVRYFPVITNIEREDIEYPITLGYDS